MTYEAFKQTVKVYLMQKLGDGYDVQETSQAKNNDTVLDTLVVHKRGAETGRAINLNGMYQLVSEGKYSMLQMMTSLVRACLEKPPFTWKNLSWITEYEQAKHKICCKLINTAANQELLKEIPSVPYLDLSIVFIVDILPTIDGPDRAYTIQVTNKMLEAWGVSTDKLFPVAMENTQRSYPAMLQSMEETLAEIVKESGYEMPEACKQEMRENFEERPMFVLSCLGHTNGAIAITYPDVLKIVADKAGCDLAIIPSSIHEWIIVADNDKSDLTFLNAQIEETNRQFIQSEERLADHAYMYSRESGMLRILTQEEALRFNWHS